MFEYFFINWKVKGQTNLQTTKFSFPAPRAIHLVRAGNSYFKKAEHWIGDQDEKIQNPHPEYREV